MSQALYSGRAPATTGNGTPLANDYVLLPHAVLAGNPQTSTNP